MMNIHITLGAINWEEWELMGTTKRKQRDDANQKQKGNGNDLKN